ncbi:hypothetical protein JXA70_04155 [candidate division KSB1 bacterium]|nr:hypothetical protein [candidate division KSB1 bacterium]
MLTLTFLNKHFNAVNIFYIVNGTEQLQAILNPGESYRQGSDEGQLWHVRDKTNDRLLSVITAKQDQVYEIKQDSHKMPVAESVLENIDTTFRRVWPKTQYALEFDGQDDVIVIGHNPSLDLTDTWTLEGWIFRKNVDVQHSVIEKYDWQAGSGGFALRIGANNKVQGGIINDKEFIFVEGQTVIEGMRWYHVAVTFDAASNALKCYVNGRLDGSTVFIKPYLEFNRPVLQFDGKNDYLAIEVDVSETAHTACLWFKTEDGNCGLFSVDAGVRGQQGHDRHIYLKDGDLCARLWENETIHTSNVNYADGKWHHVAHVFGGDIGAQRLYIDGVLGALGKKSTSDFTWQNGINIGFSNDAAQPNFKGQMAEVSVWTLARSEEEIQRTWSQRLTGSETGLLGYWKLDEGHGAVYHDASPHNNHAKIEKPTRAQMGSLAFDGQHNAVVVPHHDSLTIQQDLTVEAWVKITDLKDKIWSCPIVSKHGQASGWTLRTGAGRANFMITIRGKHYETTSDQILDLNQWYHLAGTYDGQTLKVYVDGELKNSTDVSGSITPYPGALNIGRNPQWKDRIFRGQICEAAVWHIARTPEQIKQDMEAPLVGLEKDVVGFWRMDDGVGQVVQDFSHNHNDGTIEDSAVWRAENRPVGLPEEAPRWNRFSELMLVPPQLIAKPCTSPVRIGARGDDIRTNFYGKIDSLRIWNIARSEQDVLSHWNQKLDGTEEGLQGYWRFDEGGGFEALDITDNDNIAVLGDGDPARKPEWCASSLLLMDGLQFDGKDDHLVLPLLDIDYTKGFTIECWAFFDSFKHWSRLLDLGNGPANDNILLANEAESNNLVFEVRIGAQSNKLVALSALESGTWIHLAASLAGDGTATLYKNGVPVQQGNLPIPRILEREKNYIGRSNWAQDGTFHGKIDEVRIWNMARSPRQIAGYMRRILSPEDTRLVALYSFDEGSGAVAFDSSPNSHHALLGDDRISQRPQWQLSAEWENRGLEFDGQDDCIEVAHDPALSVTGDLTIEAWVVTTETGSDQTLISKHDDGEFDLTFRGKRLAYAHGPDGKENSFIFDHDFEPEMWQHIAIVRDAGKKTVTLYVNGKTVQGKFSYEQPPPSSSHNLAIGCRINSPDEPLPFHGKIDDIRLWHITRSRKQIECNMHRRISPHTHGLVAYWPVEENAGELLFDKTTGQNHGLLGSGKISQMPKWVEVSPLQFKGFTFDGCSDYVDIPNSTDINLTTDFTISAWIKPNLFQGMQGIVTKVTDVSQCQYALSLDGEMLRFDYEKGGNNYALVGGQIAEGWNHVAVTVESRIQSIHQAETDSAGNMITETVLLDNETAEVVKLQQKTINAPKITLYINGLMATTGYAPIETDKSEAALNIGAWGGEIRGHFFHGNIDAVVIRDKAISQQEIQQRMHQRSRINTPDIVGYWRLDPTLTENIPDRSKNNNLGTLKKYQRFAGIGERKPQGCIQLDGKKDYIYCGNDPSLSIVGDLTVEAWLFPTGTMHGQTVISKHYESEYDITFWHQKLNYYHGPNWRDNTYEFNYIFAPQKWYHIAVVRNSDNKTVTLYVNGSVVQGKGVYKNDPPASSHNLSFGYRINTNSQPFEGKIDQVRLWTKARSRDEIQRDMLQSLVGIEAGLVGCWQFEEGSGSEVKDRTPNRNHGTISSGATWIPQSDLQLASAVFEKDPDIDALEFDGVKDHIAVPHDPSLVFEKMLTAGAWIKISDFKDVIWRCPIVSKHGPASGWTLRCGAGQADFMITIRGIHYSASSAPMLKLNHWHYLAGTYDGQTVKVYVDGRLVGSAEISGIITQFDGDLNIGRNTHWHDRLFVGQIAQVSLWDTALSAEDINRYMKQTLVGTETGLVSYWDFTEQSGSTVRDRSQNNNDGKLIGKPRWIEKTGLALTAPPACYYFDGSSDYVTLVGADDFQLTNDSFTVEAWVKAEDLEGDRPILGTDQTGPNKGLHLVLRDGKPYMGFYGNDLAATTKIPLNEWTHIVFCYSIDTREQAIYVNGKRVAAEVGHEPFAGTDTVLIGRWAQSHYFKGRMAEITIWDNPRTGDEINLNMRRRLSGTEHGLLGYWRLDEDSGFYAMDRTPFKNHGRLRGTGRRLPLDDLFFDTSAIIKQPNQRDNELLEWINLSRPIENPLTRSQAVGVVSPPTEQKKVTTLTISSEEAEDLTFVPVNIETDDLPSPFKELAEKLVNSINSAIGDIPKGEIKLDSSILAPFDPFQHLFGFNMEFFHIKGAYVQVIGSLGRNMVSASATLGIRLGGDVSVFGLPPVKIEADFYKSAETSVFESESEDEEGKEEEGKSDAEKDQESSTDADTTKESDDGEEKKDAPFGLSYVIKFHLPEPIGVGTFLKDVPLISGIKFYKPAMEQDDLAELRTLREKTTRTEEEEKRLKELEEEDKKRLLAIIITSEEDEDIDMIPGFNAYGTLRIGTSDDLVFRFIGAMLGVEELQLHIGASPTQFNLDATIKRHVEIIKDYVWFTETGLGVEVKSAPPETSFKLSNTVEALVKKEKLKFVGEIKITLAAQPSFGGSLTMQGDWRNPFGIPGLVVSDMAVEISGTPKAPWIDRLGYAGKVAVGKAYAQIALLVDTGDPLKCVFVGDAENIQIPDIINTLCGPDTVPGDLADVLNEIKLRKMKLSVIPQACEIGVLKFDEEGITVKVAISLFGWNAFMHVRVDYSDGITAYATLDPLNLAGILEIRESRDEQGNPRTRLVHCPIHPLNVVPSPGRCQIPVEYHCDIHPDQISDYAAYCAQCDADTKVVHIKKMIVSRVCGESLMPKLGPQLYLRISPYSVPEFYISGYAELLGISIDAFISISSSGLDADLQGKIWNLFEANLRVKVASDLSYMYIKAEMRNDFFARIREEAIKKIREAADAAVKEIEGAQEELRKAQAKVDGLLKDIDNMRLVVRAEREAISRRLKSAQAAIDGAQRKVNSILDEIRSTERYYNSLPDVSATRASKATAWVWVGPKLGGLYVAYGAATAALQAAKLILQGIDAAVLNIPIDADPRIIGLWALYGTATATLKAAEIALEGTQYIIKGAAFVGEQLTRLALGELFDIRYAMFEGEFGGPQDALKVKMQLHLVFLKQNINIAFDFDKNDIAGSVGSLVTSLIANFA